MDFNKIRSFCRVLRVIVGTSLISYGVYSSNVWFFLGIIPIILAIINFCPICIISGKCDLDLKEEKKEE